MEDGHADRKSAAVRLRTVRSSLVVFSHSDLDCRSRHIPKPVYKAAALKRTMLEAQRVKEERRRKHTRAGESKPKPERKKVVIAEQS